MKASKNSQYLYSWTQMFYALQVQSQRQAQDRRCFYQQVTNDDDSTASINTIDLDEYLVDETDGMELEFLIDDSGAVQTPQVPDMPTNERSTASTLRQQWEQWGRRSRQRSNEGKPGEVELNKRKPPDKGPP